MNKKLYSLVVLIVSVLPFTLYGQHIISEKQVIQNALLARGFQEPDISNLEITDQHYDRSNDISYAYVRQMVGQYSVFNSLTAIAFRNNEVVSVSNGLIKKLNRYEHIGSVTDMTADQAFQTVLKHLDVQRSDYRIVRTEEGTFYIDDSTWSSIPVKILPGWEFKDQKLRFVYYIQWYTVDQEHLWYIKIDASTQQVLNADDLVLSCSFGEAEPEVHPHAIPEIQKAQQTQKTMAESGYEVFAWPIESPNHGKRSIVQDPADPDASPFGWHDDNGSVGAEYTITRGNNVRARDDRNGDNTGGESPDGGTDLTFSQPFSNDSSAIQYLEAATVNLFYWNNLMHDVWYHYGFDEASGNFQENNYGKGGVGSDYVNADAQDGSGFNNANFAPLEEGTNPRMQMFLWADATDFFQVDTPNHLRAKYNAVHSSIGPRLTREAIRAKLIPVDDGTGEGTKGNGCNTLVNASEVAGNIALIDRGGCTYTQKIMNAQDAGAIGIVMINNRAGQPATIRGNGSGITIPQVMISQDEGNLLKNEIGKGYEIRGALYDSTYYFDSDFDNGVIAHEYTHGISTRLTGGASNSDCLSNIEQMGEGWSDFLSLVMTHEPNDQGTDKRGIGTYVKGQPTNGGGIRPYPYSTDFSINPVTYDDIKLNQFTVPHGVGSVWCSMLWDLYWAFIDQYGYDPDIYHGTGGNNMVMHLVTDGLKLQPCNPGFVDGRDAILKADELRFGGKNLKLIWKVFAQRGLGYSADQGSSDDKSDGSESFDMPPAFGRFSSSKTSEPTASSGDTIAYSIKVVNNGGVELETVYVKDSLGKEARYLAGSSDCDAQLNPDSSTFVMIVKNIQPGDSVECSYKVLIDTSAGGELVVYDDVETDTFGWTLVTDLGSGTWIRSKQEAKSGSTSWFINNASVQSDRWIQADFDLTKLSKPTLVFSHLFDTEDGWDGGVVEILVNQTWVDLGDLMIAGGYNQTIASNPASRIQNRDAFSGKVDDFMTTAIDLSIYAGNTVTVRFRFVSDGAQGGRGWFIDDVKLWNKYTSLQNYLYVIADGLKPSVTSTGTEVVKSDVKDSVVVIIIDVNEELVVYPNPVAGDAVIHFSSKVERTLDLQLFDLNGRQVWEGEVGTKEDQIIPMQHVAAGAYILEIMDNGQRKTVKVLKK